MGHFTTRELDVIASHLHQGWFKIFPLVIHCLSKEIPSLCRDCVLFKRAISEENKRDELLVEALLQGNPTILKNF